MEKREEWRVFRGEHGVWIGTGSETERCEIVAVMSDSLHTDQQVSNAHLVAAAPALLEAATDAFLLLQALQCISPDDPEGTVSSVLTRLRSAIDRARSGERG